MKTSHGPVFSGRRIVDMRNQAGITQSELARRAQKEQSQISRWERGDQVPAATVLGELAGALGCDVSEFFVEAAEAGSADDDEESDLLDAAHALDRAGEYSLADVLRRRARAAAVAQREMVREGARR